MRHRRRRALPHMSPFLFSAKAILAFSSELEARQKHLRKPYWNTHLVLLSTSNGVALRNMHSSSSFSGKNQPAMCSDGIAQNRYHFSSSTELFKNGLTSNASFVRDANAQHFQLQISHTFVTRASPPIFELHWIGSQPDRLVRF